MMLRRAMLRRAACGVPHIAGLFCCRSPTALAYCARLFQVSSPPAPLNPGPLAHPASPSPPAGMRALIQVLPSEVVSAAQDAAAAAAPTKRYFVAAEEAEWNYAPLGRDGCTGEAFR